MVRPKLAGLIAVMEIVLLDLVAWALLVAVRRAVGWRWKLVRVLGLVLGGFWGMKEGGWCGLWFGLWAWCL